MTAAALLALLWSVLCLVVLLGLLYGLLVIVGRLGFPFPPRLLDVVLAIEAAIVLVYVLAFLMGHAPPIWGPR